MIRTDRESALKFYKTQDLTMGGHLDVRLLTNDDLSEYPYEHLIPIARTSYIRTYPNTGENFHNIDDARWSQFIYENPQVDRDILENKADYYPVRAIWDNIKLQIKKCDVLPKFPHNNLFYQVLQLLTGYFCFLSSKPGEGDWRAFELSTSPGLPFIKPPFKVKTKEVVVNSYFDTLTDFVSDPTIPHIDTYNDKQELLQIEDLKNNKVRGTFGTAFHALIREAYYFTGQNEKLIAARNFCWIKYGLVKQYGGYDRVARAIQKFPFRWESDFSGFDRTIFLMFVYIIRLFNLHLSSFDVLLQAIVFYNIYCMVLLPNGWIVIRETGNDSGKRNTTADNGIGHFFFRIYMFAKRLQFLERPVKLSTIFENVEMAIYSDDCIGSLDLTYWDFATPDEFITFQNETAAEFGLLIKPGASLWSFDANCGVLDPKHSFLGSFFFYNDIHHLYSPFPRMGKICSSVVRRWDGKDPMVFFQRLADLALLCNQSPEEFGIVMCYIRWFMTKHPELGYKFRELLEEANLDGSIKRNYLTIVLGFEGGHSLNPSQIDH